MPTSGDAYLKAVPPRECGEFISQSQPNEPLINFILANSGRWPTSAGGTRAGVSVAQNCVGATEGDGTIAHLGRFFIAITCVYSFLNSKSEKGRPCARPATPIPGRHITLVPPLDTATGHVESQ